ncbi:hypothetical protein B0H14DRAFT_2630504 [Mycena olivaceomarginata]|nr:hypothetical protein B0H14DRAFT_2630504 [Mycena olivaceomarginata]
MRSNNQTSSHYREHTRQQDGWTVLAPGPPAGPELPPPYTPEAAPQPTSAAAKYPALRLSNLPTETARATSSASFALQSKAENKKRKSARISTNNERRTFDYTQEHRQLKAHPACAQHIGDLCFISTVDGHHHRFDPERVLLWAKEIGDLYERSTD